MQSRASVTWNGDLLSGAGSATLASGVAADLPVSWSSRTESPAGRTSPEELIAAAHAACYSMAFSNALSQAGHPPEQLDTEAVVSFEQSDDGWGITRSALSVRARVPGIDEETFQEAAEGAKVGCPVSRALSTDIEVTLDAQLV